MCLLPNTVKFTYKGWSFLYVNAVINIYWTFVYVPLFIQRLTLKIRSQTAQAESLRKVFSTAINIQIFMQEKQTKIQQLF